MENENDKKIKSYAQAALFGGILQVIFGFGSGFVNIAIFLITLVSAIAALVKNKGQEKNITVLSLIGLGLVAVAILLSLTLKTSLMEVILNKFI